jgi:hypothetical protein
MTAPTRRAALALAQANDKLMAALNAKPFDAKAVMRASLLTEKAELTLELPNAAPARAVIIREDLAAAKSLIARLKLLSAA